MSAVHERLTFDVARGEVRDQTRRYLLVRADVLMGVFDSLPAPAREEALAAFANSVRLHGADSIRAYGAAGGADALPLLMEGAAASLGWGRWTIEREERELRLEVVNSPFAAASRRSDAPACRPIAGMLEGLSAILWGGAATAREVSCAAMNGSETCRFLAAPLSLHRRSPP